MTSPVILLYAPKRTQALEEILFLSCVSFKPVAGIRTCLMLEICHLSCRRLLPSPVCGGFFVQCMLCLAACFGFLHSSPGIWSCPCPDLQFWGCSAVGARCQVSCCDAVAINHASKDLPCMFLKGKRISNCINTVFNNQDLSCLSCVKSCASTSWQTHFYCIRLRSWVAGILNSHGLRSVSSFLHDEQLRGQSNALHHIKAVFKKQRGGVG